MKVELTSRDFRDFAQRYEGTFGWLERDGKSSILVKLEEVREEKTTFVDEHLFTYSALSDRGNFFSFLPVFKGSYLYGDKIVVVQRVPARQWKRGICQTNTSIKDLFGYYYDVDFKVLKTVFGNFPNNTISKFRETLEGDLVLFDRQFSICSNQVYLYDTPIGEYQKGEIKMYKDVFSQEISDIILREGLPVNVV